MWIFNKDSFVSIVEDWSDSSLVYVRARRKSDLTNFMVTAKFPFEILHTPDNDYHFRVHISKTMLGEVLAELATKVDYSNFKNSIKDKNLHMFAAETWNSGYRNLAERFGRLY